MVQTVDSAPIKSVENVGVRKRGWMRPNACGIASHFAIDRVVRAVGKIVVWVEADAEVSTVMISSLSSGEPNTLAAERVQHVVGVAGEEGRAVVGLRRSGDDDVDQEQDQGRDDRGLAGSSVAVARLLVDGDARVPAPVDEDAEQDTVDQRAPSPDRTG